MKSERFVERHPYGFVTILQLVVILVYLVAGTVAHLLKLPPLGLYGLANLGLTVIAATVLTAMRWWKVVGFRPPERAGDLLYFLVPFIPMAINLIPGVEVSGLRRFIGVLAITAMVGFVEESFFRGLMLQAIRPRGTWRAAIVTALLFGLTHAMNVMAGKSPTAAAAQVVYATALGFGFAALVLRKGVLWPLVLAHFLIDFAFFIRKPGFAFSPGQELLVEWGLSAIFIGYGAFVMLQKPQEERG